MRVRISSDVGACLTLRSASATPHPPPTLLTPSCMPSCPTPPSPLQCLNNPEACTACDTLKNFQPLPSPLDGMVRAGGGGWALRRAQ